MQRRHDDLTEAGMVLIKLATVAAYLAVITVFAWAAIHPYSLSQHLRGLLA